MVKHRRSSLEEERGAKTSRKGQFGRERDEVRKRKFKERREERSK